MSKTSRNHLSIRFPAMFLAVRELVNHKSFFASFLLSLSIGLTGFILVDGFKESLSSYLQHRSKSILNADFSLSSNFPIDSEKKKS